MELILDTLYTTQREKSLLFTLPSGILNEDTTCVIGNGVVVHLPDLFKEIDGLSLMVLSPPMVSHVKEGS